MLKMLVTHLVDVDLCILSPQGLICLLFDLNIYFIRIVFDQKIAKARAYN